MKHVAGTLAQTIRDRTECPIGCPSALVLKTISYGGTPPSNAHNALHLDRQEYCDIAKDIRDDIISYLDTSKPFSMQTTQNWEFFRRKVLLQKRFDFLHLYENCWALDVIVRRLFYRRRELYRIHMEDTGHRKARAQTKDHASSRMARETPTPEDPATLCPRLASFFDSIPLDVTHLMAHFFHAGINDNGKFEKLVGMPAKARENFVREALVGKANSFQTQVVIRALNELTQ
ncbi:hypothetical protein HYDPIDRAFT_27187 [Hydnomerulius pinastri MD-312]|nr:hypothetical protein HYDPIDRAFT_27187 [Hydnomerulius pinastri MD-312]